MAIVDRNRDSRVSLKPDHHWTRTTIIITTTTTIVTTITTTIATTTITAAQRGEVGGANGGEPIRARCTATYGRAVTSRSVSTTKSRRISDLTYSVIA